MEVTISLKYTSADSQLHSIYELHDVRSYPVSACLETAKLLHKKVKRLGELFLEGLECRAIHELK